MMCCLGIFGPCIHCHTFNHAFHAGRRAVNGNGNGDTVDADGRDIKGGELLGPTFPDVINSAEDELERLGETEEGADDVNERGCISQITACDRVDPVMGPVSSRSSCTPCE